MEGERFFKMPFGTPKNVAKKRQKWKELGHFGPYLELGGSETKGG